MLLVAVAGGTRKGRCNLHANTHCSNAHQRILQSQSILPAAVSLLCDHHTQLLSLNCIPFLPFSPWSAPFTIWLHSLELGAASLCRGRRPCGCHQCHHSPSESRQQFPPRPPYQHSWTVYPRPGAPSQVCVSCKISRPASVPMDVAAAGSGCPRALLKHCPRASAWTPRTAE